MRRDGVTAGVGLALLAYLRACSPRRVPSDMRRGEHHHDSSRGAA